eukprot:m51a1_g3724 hypothetical protein (96) ;mRNA; f:15051-15441
MSLLGLPMLRELGCWLDMGTLRLGFPHIDTSQNLVWHLALRHIAEATHIKEYASNSVVYPTVLDTHLPTEEDIAEAFDILGSPQRPTGPVDLGNL